MLLGVCVGVAEALAGGVCDEVRDAALALGVGVEDELGDGRTEGVAENTHSGMGTALTDTSTPLLTF